MAADVLKQVRVVLVEPSHPGNIGAAARAMKTMGLERLVLVRPAGYPSAEATARASRADDILYHARRVDSLIEAVADCALILGTSARERHLAWPELAPRDAARQAAAAAARAPVALVFGREHSGLTNAELDHCSYLVRIPTSPAYSSLNLAAAVQVLAYELRLAALECAPGTVDREHGARPGELVSAGEMDGLLRHLERTATAVGFLHPARPGRFLRRMRRLFQRAGLERTEMQILRGLLRAVDQAGPNAGSEP
jgi:TrmH family RNA methyltransferase